MKFFKNSLIVMIAAFSFVLGSCEKEEENNNNNITTPEYQIFVYGRPSCGNCISFKSACDAEGMDYKFYNVDTNDVKKQEMWDKLNAAGLGGGSVTFPVVDAYFDNASHMFVNPVLQEVKDTLP